MQISPVTLRVAKAFISRHHRHNKPPVGHKFSIGLRNDAGELIGVATAGRPVARHLDDGLTLEVNRTCTTGERNANSALYGAVWRAAKQDKITEKRRGGGQKPPFAAAFVSNLLKFETFYEKGLTEQRVGI